MTKATVTTGTKERTPMAAIVFGHGITQRALAERVGEQCKADGAPFVRDDQWLSKVIRGELRLWAEDAVRIQRALLAMTGTRYTIAQLMGMPEPAPRCGKADARNEGKE